MLTMNISDKDYYNDDTSKFVLLKGKTIELEHSLVSLSKWESKWCKPFLGKDKKSKEEQRDYISCMLITKNVDPDFHLYLSDQEVATINAYIDHKMTATTFSELHTPRASNQVVTSELIYYWMISLNIPFECQKWHLNRLLTLIRVCSIKGAGPEKMPKNTVLARNRALNAARKQQLNTRG